MNEGEKIIEDCICGIENFYSRGEFPKRNGFIASYGERIEALLSTWKSMDSAPKTGTAVDLWCTPPRGQISGGDYARVPDCWFSAGKWWHYDEKHGDDMCRREIHNATAWMPRPHPPKSVT